MPLTDRAFVDFFTFRLTPALRARLRQEQTRLNVSLSHLIRTYVSEGLARVRAPR